MSTSSDLVIVAIIMEYMIISLVVVGAVRKMC